MKVTKLNFHLIGKKISFLISHIIFLSFVQPLDALRIFNQTKSLFFITEKISIKICRVIGKMLQASLNTC